LMDYAKELSLIRERIHKTSNQLFDDKGQNFSKSPR